MQPIAHVESEDVPIKEGSQSEYRYVAQKVEYPNFRLDVG